MLVLARKREIEIVHGNMLVVGFFSSASIGKSAWNQIDRNKLATEREGELKKNAKALRMR